MSQTTLAATAALDTYLDESAATTNRDTANLIVGRGTNVRKRPILKFDLSSIPANAVIVSATLSLNVTTAAAATVTVRCHRLSQTAWVEAEATWTNYSTAGGAWTAAGGDYDTGWNVGISMAGSATGIQTYPGFNALVQDALTNRSGILHMLMKYNTESAGANSFTFSDSEDATAGNRPILTVVYQTAGDAGMKHESPVTRSEHSGLLRTVRPGPVPGNQRVESWLNTLLSIARSLSFAFSASRWMIFKSWKSTFRCAIT